VPYRYRTVRRDRRTNTLTQCQYLLTVFAYCQTAQCR